MRSQSGLSRLTDRHAMVARTLTISFCFVVKYSPMYLMFRYGSLVQLCMCIEALTDTQWNYSLVNLWIGHWHSFNQRNWYWAKLFVLVIDNRHYIRQREDQEHVRNLCILWVWSIFFVIYMLRVFCYLYRFRLETSFTQIPIYFSCRNISNIWWKYSR